MSMSMLRDLGVGSSLLTKHPRRNHQPQHNEHDSEIARRKEVLKRTAAETLEVLPGILRQRNSFAEAHQSHKLSFQSLRRLNPSNCPNFPSRARIKVLNDDTLNVAMKLSKLVRDDSIDPYPHNLRPLIINFANHRKPGGGWLNGAVAQEEVICYRSSLAMSLDTRDYPLALNEAIYSPFVLVMRSDMASGHNLLTPDIPPAVLPVVSAVTLAAICRPQVRTLVAKEKHGSSGGLGHGSRPREKYVFAHDEDLSITKAKMRLALRIAATEEHTLLVLGALGCGIYANPPDEIAHCWLEVLREYEFEGNWWREVWFAVYDPKGEGNYDIFDRVLSGKKV